MMKTKLLIFGLFTLMFVISVPLYASGTFGGEETVQAGDMCKYTILVRGVLRTFWAPCPEPSDCYYCDPATLQCNWVPCLP